jgi:glycerol kinase
MTAADKPGGNPSGWVLAVDQGTSATKALVVDETGAVVASGSVPLSLHNPHPGWAEQDAEEIWLSVQKAVEECVREIDPTRVRAVGLSTQRESTLLWERSSGAPLGPMLGWQDGRGTALCTQLRDRGHADRVRAISGLPLDPMFSASKAAWLLDTYDPNRSKSRAGQLCLGTVDSWLLWRLGGDHLIEAGNAARTQLLNLVTVSWDAELLDLFGIPDQVLPRVMPSAGRFTPATELHPLLQNAAVTGVLGDSHAALFAHAGWRAGQVKATYGTGSSVMGLTDRADVGSPALARTIAWAMERPSYALEGNIRFSGATLVWLARLFGSDVGHLVDTAADSSDGVMLVPAFAGLGAPWWDENAKAVITGLSERTDIRILARAGLEAIVFQVEDVVAELEREVGRVEAVLADGGPTRNAVLMQLQADTSGRRVERATARDLSALGAAHMAGVGAGLWSMDDLDAMPRQRDAYQPSWDNALRDSRRSAWHQAVHASRGLGQS